MHSATVLIMKLAISMHAFVINDNAWLLQSKATVLLKFLLKVLQDCSNEMEMARICNFYFKLGHTLGKSTYAAVSYGGPNDQKFNHCCIPDAS